MTKQKITVREEMEFSDKPKNFTWSQKPLSEAIRVHFTYILRQSQSENTLILVFVHMNFCVCMGMHIYIYTHSY